jgi:glutaredoxin
MSTVTLIKRSQPACPACNVMQAMLNGEGIEHETIDITDTPEAIEEYGLTSVPVTLVESSEAGRGTIRFIGVQPIEEIKEAIEGAFE